MTGMFDDVPPQVSLERQIECVKREIRQRMHVYANRVKAGKMTIAKSHEEITCMEAVLRSLSRMKDDHDAQGL
jgi:hypothetical protein